MNMNMMDVENLDLSKWFPQDTFISQFKAIKNIEHIKLAGQFVKTYQNKVTRTQLSKIKNEMLNPFNVYALLMVLNPQTQTEIFVKLSFLLVKEIHKFEFPYNVSILIYYVKSYLLAKRGTQLYKSKEIHNLYKENSEFCVPYLLLCAATNNPDSSDPSLTISPRLGALALYYSGVNKMLLQDFAGADFQFSKCLLLKDYCHDILPDLVSKMSISALLSQVPKRVFFNRFNVTEAPKGYSLNIWDLDQPFSGQKMDHFAQQFFPLIKNERARLQILDLALVSERISLEDLMSIIELEPLPILTKLQKAGEIQFTIQGQNVSLHGPIISTKLEEEIASISLP